MENPNLSANTYTLPAALRIRVEALLARGQRVILGIAAAPGAGKSTLAQALHQHFSVHSQVLPMDGFHLANRELDRLGLRQCKGAPATFDSAGYLHLLRRLRQQGPEETIYAPDFDRHLDTAVAGAIALHGHTRLVITEGNYLLLDVGHWAAVRAELDEAWYLQPDPAVRHAQLLARHMHYGRSEQEALNWIRSTDEPNAQRIARTQHRADWVLTSGQIPVLCD